MAQGIINKKEKEIETDEGGMFGMYNMRQMKQRPKTPIVKHEEEEENDENISSILLIQRLLRGRAIQNQMFEGKEKRLDLIHELRASEEWKSYGDDETVQMVEEFQNKVVNDVTEALQGSIIAETLDQLSKELIRFKQERKIAAMVKLAEKDRRMREGEESGRRQAEEVLKNRENHLFREILSTHQGTIDSYLTNICNETVKKAAKEQSYQEAVLRSR